MFFNMFKRGQCFGVVSVKVRFMFEVPQGLSLAGTFKVACYRNPYAFLYLQYWLIAFAYIAHKEALWFSMERKFGGHRSP